MVGQLWPRPLLVIHARGDAWVPIDRGMELFDKASLPKVHLYLNTDRVGALHDPRAARVLRYFFDIAQPLPII
jgi:fermentation-respiration switch protein FrsA (DUF1100 family)